MILIYLTQCPSQRHDSEAILISSVLLGLKNLTQVLSNSSVSIPEGRRGDQGRYQAKKF